MQTDINPAVRAMTQQAQAAYSQWLGQEPWDLLLTLTDPGFPHPENMEKRTRYFMNRLNSHHYGKRWYKRTNGIEYVIAFEYQKRGSLHTHSLIRIPAVDVSDPAQFALEDWHKFSNTLGGHAKLEIPRDQQHTMDYVTKYTCKGGDLVFSKGLNPHKPRTYARTLIGSGTLQ